MGSGRVVSCGGPVRGGTYDRHRNALTADATTTAVVVAALIAARATFLLKSGVKYRRAPGVVALLGRQYLGTATGFLLVAVLIGSGVIAGPFRW